MRGHRSTPRMRDRDQVFKYSMHVRSAASRAAGKQVWANSSWKERISIIETYLKTPKGRAIAAEEEAVGDKEGGEHGQSKVRGTGRAAPSSDPVGKAATLETTNKRSDSCHQSRSCGPSDSPSGGQRVPHSADCSTEPTRSKGKVRGRRTDAKADKLGQLSGHESRLFRKQWRQWQKDDEEIDAFTENLAKRAERASFAGKVLLQRHDEEHGVVTLATGGTGTSGGVKHRRMPKALRQLCGRATSDDAEEKEKGSEQQGERREVHLALPKAAPVLPRTLDGAPGPPQGRQSPCSGLGSPPPAADSADVAKAAAPLESGLSDSVVAVRLIEADDELQCLLAWLRQDEADDPHSPNQWFARAGGSLVIAFDERRLFGTFVARIAYPVAFTVTKPGETTLLRRRERRTRLAGDPVLASGCEELGRCRYLIDATGVRRNCRGVGLGRLTVEHFIHAAEREWRQHASDETPVHSEEVSEDGPNRKERGESEGCLGESQDTTPKKGECAADPPSPSTYYYHVEAHPNATGFWRRMGFLELRNADITLENDPRGSVRLQNKTCVIMHRELF